MRASRPLVLALVLLIGVGFALETAAQRATKLRGEARERGSRARAAFTDGNDGGARRLHVRVGTRRTTSGTVRISGCGAELGTIELRSNGKRGHGRLSLSTVRNHEVPSCSAGDVLTIRGPKLSLQVTLQGR